MLNFWQSRAKLLVLLLLVGSIANAQETTTTTTTSSSSTEAEFPEKKPDKYSLGIHIGNVAITGDVRSKLPGIGYGLSLRKSLGHSFSVRGMAYMGTAYGLDLDAYQGANKYNNAINGTNNVKADYSTSPFVSNYENKHWEISAVGVFNTNNLNFYKRKPRMSLYALAGAGYMGFSTKINALNASDAMYDFTTVKYKNTDGSDRKASDVRKDLKNLFDGTYETWGDGFSSTKKTRNEWVVTAGVGLQYRINNRFEISAEHKISRTATDLMDGRSYRMVGNSASVTTEFDSYSFSNIGLSMRLGSDAESRWWTNPLEETYDQIADNTKKVKDATTDSDGDAISDIFDKEPNTPKGATVDSRGITLDSDKDGIPDYLDEEPFSEPGSKVDGKGKSLGGSYVRNDQIGDILKNYKGGYDPCVKRVLPTVNFDLDKYYIKPEFYSVLHEIAVIMLDCPDIKMITIGNTDVRQSDAYNQVLSWKRVNRCIDYLNEKYGISRDRFILNVKGESNPKIKGLPSTFNPRYEVAQYKNRRVEFKIAEAGESGPSSLPIPKGPKNAGRDW